MVTIAHVLAIIFMLGIPCLVMVAAYGAGYGVVVRSQNVKRAGFWTVVSLIVTVLLLRFMAIALMVEFVIGALLGLGARRKRRQLAGEGVSPEAQKSIEDTWFVRTLPIPVAVFAVVVYLLVGPLPWSTGAT